MDVPEPVREACDQLPVAPGIWSTPYAANEVRPLKPPSGIRNIVSFTGLPGATVTAPVSKLMNQKSEPSAFTWQGTVGSEVGERNFECVSCPLIASQLGQSVLVNQAGSGMVKGCAMSGQDTHSKFLSPT